MYLSYDGGILSFAILILGEKLSERSVEENKGHSLPMLEAVLELLGFNSHFIPVKPLYNP